jgi:hypothetical protein
MLNRREFLTNAAGGFVTLLLTPIVAACGSDMTYGASTTTTNGTTPTCDGAGDTSTVSNGHTHALCVPLADLDNPPASGATYGTSVTDGHRHTAALTQGQLMAVAVGQTITVTTSTVATGNLAGHTHRFAVAKAPAGAITPPKSPPVTGPYD